MSPSPPPPPSPSAGGGTARRRPGPCPRCWSRARRRAGRRIGPPPPPNDLPRKLISSGASIGSSFEISPPPRPPRPPSWLTTASSLSPKMLCTILAPSSVSTWPRSTPPSSSEPSCWPRACCSDAAPAGSWALACMPPTRAGERGPHGLLRLGLADAELAGQLADRDLRHQVVDVGHAAERRSRPTGPSDDRGRGEERREPHLEAGAAERRLVGRGRCRPSPRRAGGRSPARGPEPTSARTGWVRAAYRRSNTWLALVGRDARSVVVDPHQPAAVIGDDRHVDAAAGELRRVGEQVAEHLLDPFGVGEHGGRGPGRADRHGERRPPRRSGRNARTASLTGTVRSWATGCRANARPSRRASVRRSATRRSSRSASAAMTAAAPAGSGAAPSPIASA